MSIHKRNGKWQVKWREGESQRSRALHLKTYAHVIDALEGKARHADLDTLITAARVELEAPTWRAHSS
jgi:hypothetical protein